jgi:ATP-dependent helicase STH1/SNF2
VIVQYEMVMSKPDFGMLKSLAWSYMVVDEGHRLKNKDSKLFNVLSKDYSSRRKLILTGTPLQNNKNIYHIMLLIYIIFLQNNVNIYHILTGTPRQNNMNIFLY